MSDAGLRRLLERATAEPPADLEARVFRTARHPWKWTAVAAAIVVVAGVVAWSLASKPSDSTPASGEHLGELSRVPIGSVQPSVVTWLPDGFRETARDYGSTTWSGPHGATITAGTAEPIRVPGSQPVARPAVGTMATYVTPKGITHVVGCSISLCWVRVTGDPEDDNLRIIGLRVAASVIGRDRLSSDGTSLPNGLAVAETRPVGARNNYVYRIVFDDTAGAAEGQLLSELPFFEYPAPPPASIVTLTVGAAAHYDGFEPVRSDGPLVGWVDTRLTKVDGPKPVVSFLKEERLQGYLIPGQGFVWADQLFARRDSATTTTAVSSVPPIGALPSEVVLDYLGASQGIDGRVDVYGLDGTRLASLPGWRPHDQAGPGHEVLVAPNGRLYALTRSGLRASSAPPSLSHDRCTPTNRPGERVCGSEPGVHDVEPTITLERDGRASRRITGSPVPKVMGQWEGYWSSAELGPDGRTILATFSGECESPSVYFVDLVTGRAYQPQSGGEIRESVGMGWSSAGEAIVSFSAGVCGTAAPTPGVYRLRTDGSVAGIVTKFTDVSYAILVDVPD
jgi:hypothetical protein